MYDATKLQDDERLSGMKRDGIAGVDHHVDFHGIETLLLQRDVQSRIKYAMHVSLKLGRFVNYGSNSTWLDSTRLDSTHSTCILAVSS